MAVRTMTVGTAAAVVVAGASFASVRVAPDSAVDPGREAPVAGPPKGVVSQDRPPVYLSVDGRLRALDPVGRLHPLGVPVEEIVGATPDGVLAVDRESGLVRIRAVLDEGRWRFERADPPVVGAVQRAAVSQASGLAAWVSLDDQLVLFDLEGMDVLSRTPVGQETRLYDVGEGVLVNDAGTTLLVRADERTRPAWEGQAPWAAATGGETVALTERGDEGVVTRVYETDGKSVNEVAELPGSGDLSSDGRHYLAAPVEGEDVAPDAVPVLWTRDGGETRALTGLAGAVTGVAWADEDTAAVTIRDGVSGRTDVYTCEASTAACDLALEGGGAKVTLTY
jgi:hypothetical protein